MCPACVNIAVILAASLGSGGATVFLGTKLTMSRHWFEREAIDLQSSARIQEENDHGSKSNSAA